MRFSASGNYSCLFSVSLRQETETAVQWYKTFGGEYDDQGRSVQQTADGGYIMCGMTHSYGAGIEDVWLLRTDAEGNGLWDKTFGGEDIDAGLSVQKTMDGGYIVCGGTYSNGDNGENIWLIKTDTEGDRLWDKTFSGRIIGPGRLVQQTGEGDYIVCGITQSDRAGYSGARLIKTDAEGNGLWDKTFSEGSANSFQQTTDGGYIICGVENTPTQFDNIWLMKTDAEGNKLWEKTFGGEELAVANSVWQTTDGGYIVCGETGSYQTVKTKAWLIKTDAEGNKLWDKRFRGEELVFGNSVLQTTDGGYIVCGTTGSLQTGKTRALVIKADANGNKVWDKTFEGEWASESFSVQQTIDGGYIVCGSAKSCEGCRNRVLLLKIAPE